MNITKEQAQEVLNAFGDCTTLCECTTVEELQEQATNFNEIANPECQDDPGCWCHRDAEHAEAREAYRKAMCEWLDFEVSVEQTRFERQEDACGEYPQEKRDAIATEHKQMLEGIKQRIETLKKKWNLI